MPLHLYATVWYDAKVLCKLCCTTVMQKSNAPYRSAFLSCYVHLCIWIPARSCDVPSQSSIFKYCTSRSGMLYGRQNLLARRLLCSKLLYRLLVSKKLRRNPSLNCVRVGKTLRASKFRHGKTYALELDDEQLACLRRFRSNI